MVRYGAHGALAIRRNRTRRARRASLTSVRTPRHQAITQPVNYLRFYHQHQQRKDSIVSSQSAPVKGSENDEDTVGQIPGQIPDTPNLTRRTEESEGDEAGPSWWPGPPFQQGGVIKPSPPQEEGVTKPSQAESKSLLSDLVGVLSGRDSWGVTSRLWPTFGKSTKSDTELGDEPGANGSGDAEVGTRVVSGNSLPSTLGVRPWTSVTLISPPPKVPFSLNRLNEMENKRI
ncbi:hypothetical protein Pmani_033944 [Petrolisthes manimaculis]|uniref:Uncharacterized protein n=1 Tax=Petrolisthes manimaculis TaxID=1843537 RepID=A0AAE1NQY6_9EUCA|nr:hypothetical protein Pmani_033944 [Petrolisthes manimaculis]